MAITKTPLTVLNAVTTTQTSGVQDVSDAYGASLYIKIVQVGTPTVSATWQIQTSPDGGTTWFNAPVYSHQLAAGTYDWYPPINADATHVRVAFTAATGGTSSTCTALLSKITSLS